MLIEILRLISIRIKRILLINSMISDALLLKELLFLVGIVPTIDGAVREGGWVGQQRLVMLTFKDWISPPDFYKWSNQFALIFNLCGFLRIFVVSKGESEASHRS